MKTRTAFSLFAASLAAAVLTTSCYNLGGVRPQALVGKNTFAVDVFANHTIQPGLNVSATAAVCDLLQRDGTYTIAPRSKADFVVSGQVQSISRSSLRTNPYDSYLSSEVELTVRMSYKVTDSKTGKVLKSGTAVGKGSNLSTTGNVQGAVNNALDSAVTRAAEDLVLSLTME